MSIAAHQTVPSLDPSSPPLQLDAAPDREKRVPVLDGWRALSILCVLGAHLLPLGPKSWKLNDSAALLGMSLFFTLSGYLITSTLLKHPVVSHFLIRRLCRILPLAFLFIFAVLLFFRKSLDYYPPHLLFYMNYDHGHILPYTSHFWSLCVEMQFYMTVALIVLISGRMGLYILPLLCLTITGWRIATHTYVSIVTHLRVDEILVGATLALLAYTPRARHVCALMGRLPVLLLLAIACIATLHIVGPLNYLRPYTTALLVGATLYGAANRPGIPSLIGAALRSAPARYVADVSYALYVIHPLTSYGWMSQGPLFQKYLFKRPISFALTFLGAHLSTFYYERYWIRLGKRWTGSSRSHSPATSPVVPAVQPS